MHPVVAIPFICGQGASGGFQFFSNLYHSYTSGTTTLILDLKPFSSTFYTPLTLADNLIVGSSAISPVELSYLDGTNGNLQNQLNNKASLTTNNTWTGINNFNSNVVFNSGLTLNSNLDITTQGLTGSVSISPTELAYLL